MLRDATFSSDGKRRFDLVRDWREEIGAPDKTVLFAMLNPSTAGKKDDDPTVRKVVGFARRWGFGRAVAVNLIATISTDPWRLPHWSGIDMMNRAVVQQWMGDADLVVAAWGSVSFALANKIALAELVWGFRQTCPVNLYCIGTTYRGAPLHPSRAAYTSAPLLWEAAEEGNS